MEIHEILKMLNKMLESPGEKYLKEDGMELIKFQRSSGSPRPQFPC